MASWPAASAPVTIRVTRRPAIMTAASATGMAISSTGCQARSPGSTAGSVS